MTKNTDPSDRSLPWRLMGAAITVVLLLGVAGWALIGRAEPKADPVTTTATPTIGKSPSPAATPSSPETAIPTGTPTAVATDPAGERARLDDVKPREVAHPSESLELRVVNVESVTSKVALPEDKIAPALRVSIKVSNTGKKLFDSRFAVINAYYGDAQTPASQFLKPGGRGFPTSIGAGKSATVVYLFDIPRRERGKVDLEVDVAPQLPVTHFVGSFR